MGGSELGRGGWRRERGRRLPLAAALPKGVRILAAVSGGFDSMVMLELLAQERAGAGMLAVGHVNHALRGADSDADEALVRGEAARRGLPFHGRRLAWPEGHAPDEAALRSRRYAALKEMAREAGAGVIAFAHTRDDAAETFLIAALRGAGPDGLVGMVPLRTEETGLLLARPLLHQWRAALRPVAEAAGLRWREDASNEDARFLRARIRGQAMPWLEAFHPGAARSLARAAWLLASAMENVPAYQAALLEKAALGADGDQAALLDLHALAPLPPEARVELIRHVWQAVSPTGRAPRHRLTWTGVDAFDSGVARRLVEAGEPVQHSEDGVTLWVNSRWAVVAPAPGPEAALAMVEAQWPFVLMAPGQHVALPAEGGLVGQVAGGLEVRPAGGGAARLIGDWGADFGRRRCAIAADSLGGCVLRPVGPEDRWRGRRVRRLLEENAVPPPLRHRVAVVASAEGEVLAVPGIARTPREPVAGQGNG